MIVDWLTLRESVNFRNLVRYRYLMYSVYSIILFKLKWRVLRSRRLSPKVRNFIGTSATLCMCVYIYIYIYIYEAFHAKSSKLKAFFLFKYITNGHKKMTHANFQIFFGNFSGNKVTVLLGNKNYSKLFGGPLFKTMVTTHQC